MSPAVQPVGSVMTNELAAVAFELPEAARRAMATRAPP
jgi:hypothetical protein